MTKRDELVQVLDRLAAPFEQSGSRPSPLRVPAADTPAMPPPPIPVATRPEDVTVVVALSEAEARSGARKRVMFAVKEPCARCDGTGTRGARKRSCRQCSGTGFTAGERTLQVRIPPDSRDGTRLVVRGEGGRAAPSGPRGDLLIRVEVPS
jgi:hypothetical protein